MRQRANRVENHPILGPLPPSDEIVFSFDDRSLTARVGEVLAAALIAHGIHAFSTTERDRAPRGIYCAIGHCFACQVTVDGRPGVRACLTVVRDGMRVTSGQPLDESAAS
jgi:sarcosine oxidase subunit alpha